MGNDGIFPGAPVLRGFDPDDLVPREGQQPGYTLDRLPPGKGSIAFPEVFALLAEKRYLGALSYEAPNPAAWARDPTQVAQEALRATLTLLGQTP